ncbi:MAG: serine/threonine protein kinase [Anaerolineae bacterium]|nr:serine/threonine protein kinase [Anaerolineae bacterium]
MADLVGQQIGHYLLTALIHTANGTALYSAQHQNSQLTVSVKIINLPTYIADDLERQDVNAWVSHFERELQVVSHLTHPHIAKMVDFGKTKDFLYIVFTPPAERTLAELIREKPIPPLRASRYLSQIASALDYAHTKRVIHGNLSSECVMLDAGGNVYLSDFGLGDQRSPRYRPSSYMPPEQWEGKEPTIATDTYALGVLLFEMLTSQLPFQGEKSLIHPNLVSALPSIHELRGNIAASVDIVVSKALQRQSEARFQSVGALVQAYHNAMMGLQTIDSEDSANRPDLQSESIFDAMPPLPLRNGRLVLGVGLAALLILVTTGLIAFASGPQSVGTPLQQNGSSVPYETATLFPIRTSTNTATPSITFTSSATSTASATRTASATSTETSTVTPTNSPSATPTATLTATLTSTRTPSMTRTSTRTYRPRTATPVPNSNGGGAPVVPTTAPQEPRPLTATPRPVPPTPRPQPPAPTPKPKEKNEPPKPKEKGPKPKENEPKPKEPKPKGKGK